MIDRRGFVRMVLSAAAVSPLIDVDQLLWVPGAKTIFLPTPKAPLYTLRGAAEEVMRLLHAELRQIGHAKMTFAAVIGNGRVGDRTQDVVLTDQLTVGVDPEVLNQCSDQETIRRWHLRRIAHAFAHRIYTEGTTHTAALRIPFQHEPGVIDEAVNVNDPVSGLAIRAIRAFNTTELSPVLRMDILCGKPIQTRGEVIPMAKKGKKKC